jgi:transposase
MVKGVGKSYLTDVSDEEWGFVLPYLLLSREDNRSRQHSLRALFNGVRYIVKTGNQWRLMPHDLPPWQAVYQQMRRWMAAGCFELLVEDVQSLLREFAGRKGQPTAVCLDSRTLQSTPESGARAGYDGAKRRKGSKVHIAVDTLGHLMALTVTPADQGDRAQVAALAEQVQQVTGDTVDLAYVDQGYTGEAAAEAAQKHGIRLEVVKHPMAKRGFVLLPRRWVVERSFAWAARFRRLARDYERLDATLKGFHYLSFACIMLARIFHVLNATS